MEGMRPRTFLKVRVTSCVTPDGTWCYLTVEEWEVWEGQFLPVFPDLVTMGSTSLKSKGYLWVLTMLAAMMKLV
jgi:hypothetical protein